MRDQNKDALAHLCEIQHLAQIGSWGWNLEDRTLFWSDEVYRIFGVEPGAFVPSAEAFENMIHPDDREDFLRRREQMLAEKQSACIDHRIILPDGRIRYVQERARLISDEQGNVIRVIGTVQDITERRLLEMALEESEKKYRTLSENTSDIIARFDRNYRHLYANPAAEHITGIKSDDYIGKTHRELGFPPEQCDFWEAMIENVFVNEHTVNKEVEFDGIIGKCYLDWLLTPEFDESGKVISVLSNVHDITALKKAEAALSESEKRYRSIFETACEGICQLDQQNNILLANQQMADMLGYAIEDMSGHNLFEFIDKCNEKDYSLLTEECKKGISQKFDFCFRRKDGSELWAMISGKPIMTDDGDFSYGLVMITDITKRKHAENQLFESRQILRTMIDLNPEAVFMLDTRGIVLAANQRLASGMKKGITQIVGANIFDLIPPDHVAEERRKHIEQVIQTGKASYLEDRRGDRYLGSHITPEFDEYGKVIRIAISVRDITERKEYENMLRQSGERYRSFIETMNDGFVVVNKDLTIAYANKCFCRMIGCNEEELIGKKSSDFLDEENMKILKEQILKRKRGESAPYEIRFICKDGSSLSALASPTPVSDSDGRFQGSFAIVTDISRQKQKEKRLMSDKELLEKQIESAASVKSRLYRQLEEYNHALKVLLNNVQNEKKEAEENISFNIKKMVTPFIEKLRNTRLSRNQKNFVALIETNLNDIVSPFIGKLRSEAGIFTPMEIQVARMIKDGNSNKEIAEILAVSENTVLFHRRNIRKKLGLNHKKMNLRTCLMSFD